MVMQGSEEQEPEHVYISLPHSREKDGQRENEENKPSWISRVVGHVVKRYLQQTQENTSKYYVPKNNLKRHDTLDSSVWKGPDAKSVDLCLPFSKVDAPGSDTFDLFELKDPLSIKTKYEQTPPFGLHPNFRLEGAIEGVPSKVTRALGESLEELCTEPADDWLGCNDVTRDVIAATPSSVKTSSFNPLELDDSAFLDAAVDSKSKIRKARTNTGIDGGTKRSAWMPDQKCIACFHCSLRFTTFRRKHHCRVCGQVFCYRCCNNYISGTKGDIPSRKNTVFKSREKQPKNGDTGNETDGVRYRVCAHCYELGLEPKFNVGNYFMMSVYESSGQKVKNTSSMRGININDDNVSDQKITDNSPVGNACFVQFKEDLSSAFIGYYSRIFEAVSNYCSLLQLPTTYAKTIASLALLSTRDKPFQKRVDLERNVQIEFVGGTNVRSSYVIHGVAFQVFPRFEDFQLNITNCRLLLLSTPLTFQGGRGNFICVENLIKQEEVYLEMLANKIVKLNPNVILCSEAIAGGIRTSLRQQNIACFANVPLSKLKLLTTCTNACILPSLEFLDEEGYPLGVCGWFGLQRFQTIEKRTFAIVANCNSGSVSSILLRCSPPDFESFERRGEAKLIHLALRRAVQFCHACLLDCRFLTSCGAAWIDDNLITATELLTPSTPSDPTISKCTCCSKGTRRLICDCVQDYLYSWLKQSIASLHVRLSRNQLLSFLWRGLGLQSKTVKALLEAATTRKSKEKTFYISLTDVCDTLPQQVSNPSAFLKPSESVFMNDGKMTNSEGRSSLCPHVKNAEPFIALLLHLNFSFESFPCIFYSVCWIAHKTPCSPMQYDWTDYKMSFEQFLLTRLLDPKQKKCPVNACKNSKEDHTLCVSCFERRIVFNYNQPIWAGREQAESKLDFWFSCSICGSVQRGTFVQQFEGCLPFYLVFLHLLFNDNTRSSRCSHRLFADCSLAVVYRGMVITIKRQAADIFELINPDLQSRSICEDDSTKETVSVSANNQEKKSLFLSNNFDELLEIITTCVEASGEQNYREVLRKLSFEKKVFENALSNEEESYNAFSSRVIFSILYNLHNLEIGGARFGSFKDASRAQQQFLYEGSVKLFGYVLLSKTGFQKNQKLLHSSINSGAHGSTSNGDSIPRGSDVNMVEQHPYESNTNILHAQNDTVHRSCQSTFESPAAFPLSANIPSTQASMAQKQLEKFIEKRVLPAASLLLSECHFFLPQPSNVFVPLDPKHITSFIAYAVAYAASFVKTNWLTSHNDEDDVAAFRRAATLHGDDVLQLEGQDNLCVFAMSVFYPAQFHLIRKKMEQNEKRFVKSLVECSPFRPLGGKSGAPFIISNDRAYVLKQLNKYEFRLFCTSGLTLLNHYAGNIWDNIPSTLAGVYGVFQIDYKCKVTGESWSRKLVLLDNLQKNLNYQHDLLLFDLKGVGSHRYFPRPARTNSQTTANTARQSLDSEIGLPSSDRENVQLVRRRVTHLYTTKPSDTSNHMFEVLWDQNFREYTQGIPLLLESPTSYFSFIDAIEHDTGVFKNLDVVDYSLLVMLDRTAKSLQVAMIDFLRPYTWDKQMENMGKSLVYMTSGMERPTVVSPVDYQGRFCKEMRSFFNFPYPVLDQVFLDKLLNFAEIWLKKYCDTKIVKERSMNYFWQNKRLCSLSFVFNNYNLKLQLPTSRRSRSKSKRRYIVRSVWDGRKRLSLKKNSSFCETLDTIFKTRHSF